jgi:hypothetical protein
MTGLGALTFLNPWALAGLIILPIIYWLLRFTPPRPQTVKFPPLRLLLGLVSKQEEADKTPWWLIVLRLALATLVIFAVAQPVLTNENRAPLSKDPLLIVIDNDWSTAGNWPRHHAILLQTIENAKARGVPVALAATSAADNITIKMQNAVSAQNLAATISPQSFPPQRKLLIRQLQANFKSGKALQIIWLSNGRAGTGAKAFSDSLKGLAGGNARLSIIAPPVTRLPVVLKKPQRRNGKIIATIVKNPETPAVRLSVSLLARNGRNLAKVPISFTRSPTETTAVIDLPLALRNEAARLEISGQNHAGAVYLIDDQWRRKSVGIITGESLELAQPLLSPLYYVTRALSPVAELMQPENDTETVKMLQNGLSMLVMADVGFIVGKQRAVIEKWIKKGGVLVRFAGPHLAENAGANDGDENDPLVPVQLRRGGRALGSALSWQQPQALAPFETGTPLAGLKLDRQVTVRRQVLAEPTSDLSGRVWASLDDGTPLITARRHGAGLVVLVHITANSDWSNLPLSGMFVKILERILSLAPAVTSTGDGAITAGPVNLSGAFIAHATLDGFGKLLPPVSTAKPVKPADFEKISASKNHPAGLYRRASVIKALNLLPDANSIKPLAAVLGAGAVSPYSTAPSRDLAPWLFIGAFIVFLLDSLAALFLMGGLQRLKNRAAALSVLAAASVMLFAASDHAKAQTAAEQKAMDALGKTRFAYVLTGDNLVDATSLAGLKGLNMALRQRTSVDPGRPHSVDLENDEIVFYPLLYWPVLENAKAPSDKVVAKLATFMKNGGTIFFDTRDQDASFANLTGASSQANQALRRILYKFDIPALEPVPPRHVLTRAFYLMQQFPGRWIAGKLWVQASTASANVNDGVSSIIIGSNDYASAWAIDATGKPLYPTIPGTPRQREFAYRTGINIVMYTLTGNYKADQVHVPALLRRLGQ